jgi:RNA polymerase sigma factor (sigma-70 family)
MSRPVSNKVREILQENKISGGDRIKINNLLYECYKDWTRKQVFKFKYKHYYKRISTPELLLYGDVGLFKAIRKYNGKAEFHKYAGIYIDGELKNAISDSYSLSIIPRAERKKKRNITNEVELEEYKNKLEVRTYGRPNHWTYNNNFLEDLIDEEEKQNFLREKWYKINQLSGFQKRIMYLKYDYEFNSIRSNNKIGKLMCCSEEWVRKNVIELKEKLI